MTSLSLGLWDSWPPPRLPGWDPGPGRPQLALAGASPKVSKNMGASPADLGRQCDLQLRHQGTPNGGAQPHCLPCLAGLVGRYVMPCGLGGLGHMEGIPDSGDAKRSRPRGSLAGAARLELGCWWVLEAVGLGGTHTTQVDARVPASSYTTRCGGSKGSARVIHKTAQARRLPVYCRCAVHIRDVGGRAPSTSAPSSHNYSLDVMLRHCADHNHPSLSNIRPLPTTSLPGQLCACSKPLAAWDIRGRCLLWAAFGNMGAGPLSTACSGEGGGGVSLTCPPTKNPRASVVWLGRTGLIVLSLCLPKTGIQTSRVALLPVLAFPKSPVSIHVLARAGGVRVCGLLLGARWQPSQRRKGWMPSLLGVVRDHFSMGQPGQRGQSHGRDRRRGCAAGPTPARLPVLTLAQAMDRNRDHLPSSPFPPQGSDQKTPSRTAQDRPTAGRISNIAFLAGIYGTR